MRLLELKTKIDVCDELALLIIDKIGDKLEKQEKNHFRTKHNRIVTVRSQKDEYVVKMETEVETYSLLYTKSWPINKIATAVAKSFKMKEEFGMVNDKVKFKP